MTCLTTCRNVSDKCGAVLAVKDTPPSRHTKSSSTQLIQNDVQNIEDKCEVPAFPTFNPHPTREGGKTHPWMKKVPFQDAGEGGEWAPNPPMPYGAIPPC